MAMQSHRTASPYPHTLFSLHCGADEWAEKEKVTVDRGEERTAKGLTHRELVHDFEAQVRSFEVMCKLSSPVVALYWEGHASISW